MVDSTKINKYKVANQIITVENIKQVAVKCNLVFKRTVLMQQEIVNLLI